MLCLLLSLLIAASFLDIKSRNVPNLLLVFIFFIILIYSIRYSTFNFYGVIVCGVILILGVLLSCMNILGGADSKLLAILVLAINTEFLILLPIILAVSLLLTIAIWVLATVFRPDWSNQGIPMIPAISLAGFLCIWFG